MRIKQNVAIILIILGLLTGITAGFLLWVRKDLFSASTKKHTKDLSEASAGAEPVRIKGTGNAIVTLEEFGDFQCPPCAWLHKEMKKLEAEYGSQIQIIFRHFPLPIHKQSHEAAQASEAAALQGKFWEMQDLLFERQEEWSEKNDAKEIFTNYARMLNLDIEKFSKDMESPKVKERIELDKKRGESIYISATPTLFVNGRKISSKAVTPEGIRNSINQALK